MGQSMSEIRSVSQQQQILCGTSQALEYLSTSCDRFYEMCPVSVLVMAFCMKVSFSSRMSEVDSSLESEFVNLVN